MSLNSSSSFQSSNYSADQIVAGSNFPPATSTNHGPPESIAIIGMACIFPKAPDLQTFWNNIVTGVDAVGEPTTNWDAQRYLESGRIKTQAGGYLKDLYRFNPREFGIMPNSMDGAEPDQFLALRVARDALLDAGYFGGEVDHTDTGIVLGHSTYLHRGQVTVVQNDIVVDQTMELVTVMMPHLEAAALASIRALLQKKLPPMNSDTAPGLVPNVMTGRIANRLNLRGPNYLVDAACSSSLLAVAAAIDELRAGRSRMMLAGGVNASLPADVTTIFTQLGALSSRGKVRPFEVGSDGTLLGEGLGVIVLKRLIDALADGDRIYAVLRGVAQSSDGRGTGLLAPSHDGETLAIRRAYAASQVDPSSVTLVEAHGTGIPLGDRTEIASLKTVFGERRGSIGTKAIGSVKSMISHCIPAAGVASLIKTSLALHHRVLPPTLCDRVNPDLGIDTTPFYVNTKASPWIGRLNQPRRAAVNAFGFGGTNSHAILEEAPPNAARHTKLGAWPAELCVMSADTADLLVAKLEHLQAALKRNPAWRIADVAAALTRADNAALHRIAIVAKDIGSLDKRLTQAILRLREGSVGSAGPRATRGTVAYGAERVDGKLAFLFPGEGSQYPAMFADLASCFEPIQRWLDFWHGLYGLPTGDTRTDIVFPTCDVDPSRRKHLEHRMHDMDVGSEAVFIGGMAMYELLASMGVQADVMVGHSSGESAALGATGANPATTPEERSDCIRQHFEAYETLLEDGKIPTGALLAVGALPPNAVDAHLATVSGVEVAMDNCGNQLVLYGTPDGISEVQKSLGDMGGICIPLPFDRGYHTPAFRDASAAFLKYYHKVGLRAPRLPLYSCASVDLFPDDAAGVCELAAAQWSQKVRFRETVLKMHDDGVRLFVEVGPSSSLTAFVNDILIDHDFIALPTNVRRKSGVEQFLSALGQLYVAGRGPVLERLFVGRAVACLDLNSVAAAPNGVLLDNTMPVIRLSETDRLELAEIISVSFGKGNGKSDAGTCVESLATGLPTSQCLVPSHEESSELAIAEFESSRMESSPKELAVETDHVYPTSRDSSHERAMGSYFGMMRDFIEQQRTLVERWPAASTDSTEDSVARFWPSTHAGESRTPLLDLIVEREEDSLLARCHVSLVNDNFIRDHVLSGRVSGHSSELFGLSCVPFSVSLEVMAEACALLADRFDVRVIENVKAFDWISLDTGELTFDVRASAVDRQTNHYTASVITSRGPVLTADFYFDSEFALTGVAPLVDERSSVLNAPNLYATGMFHGPVFQSMTYVEAWDDTGIDVRLSCDTLLNFFTEGHEPQLVLNPVLLDAMGQVVACWLVQYVGTDFHAFPSTIGRIELYDPCPLDRSGVVMKMRQRPVDGVSLDIAAPRAWEFDCVDGDGRVLMRGRDLVNLFFRVPSAYHEVRKDPLNGWLGHAVPIAAHSPLLLWEIPLLSEEFCSQSGAICLRVLAHSLLAPAERDEWHTLQGHIRRRREWLFGRAALKEAVRAWVHSRSGHLLYPSDILVQHDDLGAPIVSGWWCNSLSEAPSVSLSHNSSACIAAVTAPSNAVGVDLEELGRIKQPELILESLAPQELRLVHGLHDHELSDRLLRLWCAKEAAAKCLGIGLQGSPSAFVVVSADELYTNLVVRHDFGTVEVQVLIHDTQMIALSERSVEAVEGFHH